jgi:NAD(P)-dependent dehydrogenase (short-subunit alcohol dehydrogenase family)
MASVSGKVVFITGGAHGIGAETARQLVRKGAKVALVDLDGPRLDAVVAELGESAVGIHGDVCDLEQMEAAATEAVARFGRIDVTLANAGIASYGSLEAVDPAAFRKVIDINVTGVFHTLRATLDQLVENRGYALVVSSAAAYAAAPGMVAYDASKAGAEHLANAFRLEVAHRGVTVGSAHMLWIDTPLVRESREDLSAANDLVQSLPGPLKDTVAVEDCAAAFVEGIEQRKTRVSVPGWVGLLRFLKPLLTTRLAERRTARDAAKLLPLMDAQVRALGRSLSARTAAITGDREPIG